MSILRIGVTFCAVVILTACAGTSSPSPITPATETSAPSAAIQTSINTVLSALVGAVNATNSQSQGSNLTATGLTDRTLPIAPQFTTCNAAGCSVFEQFQQQEACSGGGYSTITSQLNGVINTNASGTLNWTSYSSFVDCSRSGWVTNSVPYLTGGGTVRIFGNRMTMNITMGGGFEITSAPGVPKGRSECHFSGVLYQWDSLTGWSNSGSVVCTPGGSFKL